MVLPKVAAMNSGGALQPSGPGEAPKIAADGTSANAGSIPGVAQNDNDDGCSAKIAVKSCTDVADCIAGKACTDKPTGPVTNPIPQGKTCAEYYQMSTPPLNCEGTPIMTNTGGGLMGEIESGIGAIEEGAEEVESDMQAAKGALGTVGGDVAAAEKLAKAV
eukprot:g2860.t1